jgi:hypothetical protein
MRLSPITLLTLCGIAQAQSPYRPFPLGEAGKKILAEAAKA